MLTTEILLAKAIAHEVLGEKREAHEAMTAAKWLEDSGLGEVKQIGDIGGQNLAKGQRVKIKKGTVIRTTHPRYSRSNPKVAGRDYTVTIYDIYNGYINTSWHSHRTREAVRNAEIVWPGEGGYWCYVDTSEVEIVQ